MKSQDLPFSIQQRCMRPATWGAALLFGGIWVLVRALSGIPLGNMGLGEFLVPAALLAGHIALAPVPWQWTGDERAIAPAWRGCLQALPWNALWLGIFLLTLEGTFRPPPQEIPPPAAQSDNTQTQATVPETQSQPQYQQPQTNPQAIPQSLPKAETPQPYSAAQSPLPQPPLQSFPQTEEQPSIPEMQGLRRRPQRQGQPLPQGAQDFRRQRPQHEGQPPPRENQGPRQPRPQYEEQPPPPETRDAQRPEPQREEQLPLPEAPSSPQPSPQVSSSPLPPEAQRAPTPSLQSASKPSRPVVREQAVLPAPASPPLPNGLLPVLPEHRSELMLMLMNFPFAMVLGWFLAEKERAESTEQELQTLAREAHLKALQSQLHPHALYNTLSGLTELIHEDPDAAEEALIGLTELLRMLTRQSGMSELPLAQERELIRHYLRIEEIRLGPRLTVNWNWPDWADAIALPPLLLQPLVENAIKHGISPAPEGGTLKIGVFRSGRELVLRVANTGKPIGEQHAEGTGLKNLRERLILLEHLTPSLGLHMEDGWTLAELRLRLP